MVEYAVSEEKNKWLAEKMALLGVGEEDIEERFVRSSGKGGQHVNKTSTCVWLRHVPTGIEVKCMAERSQSVNRFLARRELLERLERLQGKQTKREAREDKLRKQKARRKRRGSSKYGNENGKKDDGDSTDGTL